MVQRSQVKLLIQLRRIKGSNNWTSLLSSSLSRQLIRSSNAVVLKLASDQAHTSARLHCAHPNKETRQRQQRQQQPGNLLCASAHRRGSDANHARRLTSESGQQCFRDVGPARWQRRGGDGNQGQQGQQRSRGSDEQRWDLHLLLVLIWCLSRCYYLSSEYAIVMCYDEPHWQYVQYLHLQLYIP